jgi:hypothetical protein
LQRMAFAVLKLNLKIAFNTLCYDRTLVVRC